MGLDLYKVVSDAIYRVGTGLADGVGQGIVEIHLRVAGESAFVVVVAEDGCVWYLALCEGVDYLEQGLEVVSYRVTLGIGGTLHFGHRVLCRH